MFNAEDAQKLVDELVARWNAKNPESFAALFRDDAVFIDVVGNTMLGPKQIGEGHARPWSTILADAVLTADAVTLRAVTPDVCTAEMRWVTTGHRAPTGDELPPRRGVMLVVMGPGSEGLAIVQVCNADHSATYRRGDDRPGPPPNTH
ncbi:MAG: hypothetical protein CMH57_15595 [Myxococcales bacterium]|nr:hypothetical protein [Myxococcales bacterium]